MLLKTLHELKRFWTTIIKSSHSVFRQIKRSFASNASLLEPIAPLSFYLEPCLEYAILLGYSMNSIFNLNLWGSFQPQTEQRVAGRFLIMVLKKKNFFCFLFMFLSFLAAFPHSIMMYSIHNKRYLANYTLSSRSAGINNTSEIANQYEKKKKKWHGCKSKWSLSSRALTHSSKVYDWPQSTNKIFTLRTARRETIYYIRYYFCSNVFLRFLPPACAAAPAETKQYTKSFISCCSSVGAWCRLGNRRFFGTAENLHYSVSPSAITQHSLNQKKRNRDVQTIKNKARRRGRQASDGKIHLRGNQSIHQSIHPSSRNQYADDQSSRAFN